MLESLEPALRSLDPDERRGGRRVLERFDGRKDLYADVDRRIEELKRLSMEVSRSDQGHSERMSLLGRESDQRPDGVRGEGEQVGPIQANDSFRQSNLALPAIVIAFAAIAGVIPPLTTLSTNYQYPPEVWFAQDFSRILVGIAFCLLALKAESFSAKILMTSGYLMLPVAILQSIDHVVAQARRNSQDQVYHLATVFAYPALLALASVIAIVFGWTVFRAERLAWASILTAWGVCGLFMTILSYLARVHPEMPPFADSVLLFQNFILLAAAILMFRESRATVRLPVRQA